MFNGFNLIADRLEEQAKLLRTAALTAECILCGNVFSAANQVDFKLLANAHALVCTKSPLGRLMKALPDLFAEAVLEGSRDAYTTEEIVAALKVKAAEVIAPNFPAKPEEGNSK